MQEFIENIWNSPSRYAVIVIGAIIVLYIPFMIVFMRRKKRDTTKFLEQHPDAVRVFVKLNAVIGGQTSVMTVNGEKPVRFTEGIKQGFFLLPGESTVQFTYSWTRPGVMYKTVTTTIGPVSAQLMAEAGKSYQLSYDKKAEAAVFEEV